MAEAHFDEDVETSKHIRFFAIKTASKLVLSVDSESKLLFSDFFLVYVNFILMYKVKGPPLYISVSSDLLDVLFQVLRSCYSNRNSSNIEIIDEILSSVMKFYLNTLVQSLYQHPIIQHCMNYIH